MQTSEDVRSPLPNWVARHRAALRGGLWTYAITLGITSAAVGFHRAAPGDRYDFKSFYGDASFLARGGDLVDCRLLEWYLPGFRVMLTPLGRLDSRAAAAVWAGINLVMAVVAFAALAFCARRLTAPEQRDAGLWSIGAAFFLIAPLVFYNFQISQVSLWPLAMLMLAAAAVVAGRWRSAGACLGLAIFFKFIPALLVGWLALRRRYMAAAIAITLPAALSFGIDAAVHGPSRAWSHHAHWYEISFRRSAGAAFLEREPEWRTHENQGLAATLGRLLQPTPTATTGVLGGETRRQVSQVNIADLSAETIRWIYRGIVIASGLALAALTFRARRDTETEFAVLAIWCLAIIWFAPLARQYYEVWGLPALWFLAVRLWRHQVAGSRGLLCSTGLIAWLLGCLAWAAPELRALGINQWVNLVVMGAVAGELPWRAKPTAT